MDDDRIRGTGKVLKGKAKQAAGRAVDDGKLKREGAADRVAGKAQRAIGRVKDSSRDRDPGTRH